MRLPRRTDLAGYRAEITEYALAVVGHFVSFTWFVIAGVLAVLSEFAGPLRFIPTWTWWVVAMVGLTVAQFRAYHDVRTQLGAAIARAGDLTTREAKLAYIDRAWAEGSQIKDDVDNDEFKDRTAWSLQRPRLAQDIDHWESEVRANLRRWFEPGTDRFFDSEDGVMTDEQRAESPHSQQGNSWYLGRRLTRLGQIREQVE